MKMPTIFNCCAATALAAVAAFAAMKPVVVGIVVDENSQPVRTAHVRLRSDDGQTIGAVGLDGRFAIPLRSEPPSVIAEITAPGFESRRRTLVLVDGVADAGTVVMKHAQHLTLHSLTVTTSGTGRQHYFDVFVENDSDQALDLVSTSLRASRRRATNCLDATPALQFTVQDDVQAGHVNVTVHDAAAQATDAVAATGTVRSLPCEQQQIDITLPYSFQMKAHERNKVRIAIPSTLRVVDRRAAFPVAWEDFATVTLSFRTGDGIDAAIHWPE
jgi:hypothetical protein